MVVTKTAAAKKGHQREYENLLKGNRASEILKAGQEAEFTGKSMKIWHNVVEVKVCADC